jgi:hypothetical protein
MQGTLSLPSGVTSVRHEQYKRHGSMPVEEALALRESRATFYASEA